MNREELINKVVMISVFGLVLSIWCTCVVLWIVQYIVRLRKVQQRLDIAGKPGTEAQTLRLWRQMHKDARADSDTPPKQPFLQRYLDKLKNEAGWSSSAQSTIAKLLGAACLIFAVVYLLGGGVLLGLGISAGLVAIFWMYTQSRISNRATLFEKQLVDALGIAARALRAGHPLTGAFRLIAEEIDEPQGPVFAKICQEQALGLDMKDSIRKVASTTYNTELKLFATSVAIQLNSGGNLADLMDSLASVIRVRMKLNRRVRVLTAQTQLSKRILIALPILLFVVLNVISPEYMETFYTTMAGQLMLGATGGIVCLGSWMMSRLSVLRY